MWQNSTRNPKLSNALPSVVVFPVQPWPVFNLFSCFAASLKSWNSFSKNPTKQTKKPKLIKNHHEPKPTNKTLYSIQAHKIPKLFCFQRTLATGKAKPHILFSKAKIKPINAKHKETVKNPLVFPFLLVSFISLNVDISTFTANFV